MSPCNVCRSLIPTDEYEEIPICRSCYDHGIDEGSSRQAYERRKAERARAIRAAYDGGATVAEIARTFTLSYSSAHRYIARYTSDPDSQYRRSHPRAVSRGTEPSRSSPGRVAAFGSVSQPSA